VSKRKKKAAAVTGRMSLFVGRVTVTRGGRATVLADVHVERRLVDGVWVVVTPAKRKDRQP